MRPGNPVEKISWLMLMIALGLGIRAETSAAHGIIKAAAQALGRQSKGGAKPSRAPATIDNLCALHNQNWVVYASNADSYGSELWKWDGVEDLIGSELVKDINPLGDSSPHNMCADGAGIVYFAAADGTHGEELWRTDGTAAGTWMVKDIWPGSASSQPQNMHFFNGALYFMAGDGVHGIASLWRSDGTNAGTNLFMQTWIKDAAGVNGWLYFSNGQFWRELWKTDGSAANTAKIYPDFTPSQNVPVRLLTPKNGIMYFIYENLWRSDGTLAGTTNISPSNAVPSTGAESMVVLGNQLLLRLDGGASYGNELFRSDGTLAGLAMVKDINPGSGHSDPQHLVGLDGVGYFQASDGVHGAELWKTDTTGAGTAMIRDIISGSAASAPDQLFPYKHDLFFVANDGLHGRELWFYFPSGGEAVRGMDVLSNDKPIGPNPLDFTLAGEKVYFTADTLDTPGARMIWVIWEEPPPVPVEFSTFAVE